jgi:methylglyoxal synthase
MNIALVAHDSRKKELIEWVTYNFPTLKEHKLFATGTTGKLIKEAYLDWWEELECEHDVTPTTENWKKHEEEAANLVTCVHSGPLGGDQEIGAMIANDQIDALFFFCDNLIQQGHQNDVSALVRLASLYNIAFATNRTTADMIITSPLLKDNNYQRIIPAAIENYKNRTI